MGNTKRINSIDFFRIISCFLIVCIHLNFYEVGTVRWYSRFAVLFFFVISGYFFTLCNEEKQIKQIKKIGKLTLIFHLFYFIEEIIVSFIKHKSFSLNNYIKISSVLTGVFPFAYHLWFLNALVISLGVLYLFRKKGVSNKIILIVSTLLILINLSIGTYGKFLLNLSITPDFVANWLLTGIPFVFIGSLISNIKEEKYFKFKNIFLIGILISILLMYLELKIISLIGWNTFDNSIGAMILSVMLIFYSLCNPMSNNKIIGYMANIGKNILYIFIFFIRL